MPDSDNSPNPVAVAIAISARAIAGEAVQTVNARDLHAFLGIGTAFKDWIARRIADYGFTEGADFCSFLSETSGGRPGKEYALSLDMAKELSMVERNDRGKQARRYFLACEKRALRALSPQAQLSDPAVLRNLLLQKAEKQIELEARIEADAPKVLAFNRIASTEGSHCLTDAAKMLQIRRIDLERELHARDWIYRRPGTGRWHGKSSKEQQGLLTHKWASGRKPDGTEWSDEQVRITLKGLAKIAMLLGVALAAAA